MKKITLPKLKSALKVSAFIALASLSFNAMACHCMRNEVYVGNPTRPDTIWKPGHCSRGSCWVNGHYLKIMTPVSCRNIVWVDGHYNKHGHYIPAHWCLKHYRVINYR